LHYIEVRRQQVTGSSRQQGSRSRTPAAGDKIIDKERRQQGGGCKDVRKK
jgi:hypothetical protein